MPTQTITLSFPSSTLAQVWTTASVVLTQGLVVLGPFAATDSAGGAAAFQHDLTITVPLPLDPDIPGAAAATATVTIDGIPTTLDPIVVTLAVSSPTDQAVNTALVAVGPGNYNPDGDWPGMYCTAADVFANSIGLDWKAVHAKMCEYGVVQYSDVTTIADMIGLHFIPDAEADADSRMRQTLKPTQRSQFFNGSGANSLLLPYTPVLSIDAARIYVIPSVVFYEFQKPRLTKLLGAIDPDTAYADGDLLVDPETGRIVIPAHVLYGDTFQVPLWNYNFLSGDWNIEVVWTYGINGPAYVPSALRQATALLVVIRGYEFLGAIQRSGLTGSKIGASQTTVGREKNLPYSGLIERLEAKVKRLLLPLQNAA